MIIFDSEETKALRQHFDEGVSLAMEGVRRLGAEAVAEIFGSLEFPPEDCTDAEMFKAICLKVGMLHAALAYRDLIVAKVSN